MFLVENALRQCIFGIGRLYRASGLGDNRASVNLIVYVVNRTTVAGLSAIGLVVKIQSAFVGV